MDNNNITPETLPEEEINPQEGGEGAVEDTSNEETTPETEPEKAKESVDNLSLDELNSLLGKEFPTKDAALKSIKDTYNHVGKRQETIADDLKKSGDFMTREEFNTENFFKDNPAHAENRTILEAIAKNKGVSVSEAVKDESYASLFAKSAKYEEQKGNESVMDSNPRIAEQKERFDEIGELKRSGKTDEAGSLAAKTVLEAYSDN